MTVKRIHIQRPRTLRRRNTVLLGLAVVGLGKDDGGYWYVMRPSGQIVGGQPILGRL
jgi:hypothetical protein